ncbi:MAG TPA: DoxX family membrane protein [Polyangia bacterium]|jgi:thiosulfate dehydrogenase [quinone] large subunit
MDARRSIDFAGFAYPLFRIAMGVDLLMHGCTRLAAGPGHFAAGLVAQFRETFLPASLVYAFGWGLTILETVVGAGILFGLFLGPALVLGAALMIALIFGTALRSQWDIVTQQLIYALSYYVLLIKLDDRLTLDRLRRVRAARHKL